MSHFSASRPIRELDTAQRLFDEATAPFLAARNERIRELMAEAGSPKARRERAALHSLWKDQTKTARELLDRSEAEILEDGEISEATSFAWDALIASQNAQQGKAEMMAAFDRAIDALRAA